MGRHLSSIVDTEGTPALLPNIGRIGAALVRSHSIAPASAIYLAADICNRPVVRPQIAIDMPGICDMRCG